MEKPDRRTPLQEQRDLRSQVSGYSETNYTFNEPELIEALKDKLARALGIDL